MFITGNEPSLNQGERPVFTWSMLRDLHGSEICWKAERDGFQPVCLRCWRSQKKLAELNGRLVVREQ